MKNYIYTLLICFTALVHAQPSPRYVHILCSPDTITAGTPVQITISIIIDSVPLERNTYFKIFFPKEFNQFAFDNNPPPFPAFPSLQHGYCRSTGSPDGLKASIVSVRLSRDEFVGTYPYNGYNHEDNEYIMTVQLDTDFYPGDTLKIIYGYDNLINYVNVQNFSFTSGFKCMVDPDRNGSYVFQNSFAPITAVAKKASTLKLVTASSGKPGKPVLLKAIIADDNISIYPKFTGSFQLSCSDPSALFNPVLNFNLQDSGHVEIPVTFSHNGIYMFNAQFISGNVTSISTHPSNPVVISNDSLQIFWGDFHTHTEYSRDGTGDHAFYYAKYGAPLDFFAQTDHADGNGEYGIDSTEWNDIVSNVKRYNSPGRFVTFMGYEESMSSPSGHYNVIFNVPDDLLSLVPNLPKTQYNTIQSIWQRLDQLDPHVQAITIPHCTGKIFSIFPFPVCASCNDMGGNYASVKYKKLFEIYSGHGLSEAYHPSHPLSYESLNATAKSADSSYYLQDAIAMREKLGVIASSDNHLARATQKQAGVFAVLADTLERNNIYQHVVKRHTYATTGERILMKFYVNDHPMGDELNVACKDFPLIRFEVTGTDSLDYIELMKWDFKNGQYTSSHPVFKSLKKYLLNGTLMNYSDSLIDGFLTDTSVYYLRVKQKEKVDDREVWAWSSPVWVNKPHCVLPFMDKIVQFDAIDSSSHDQYKIKTSWTVANQVNADYYILQRSSDSISFSDYARISASGRPGDTARYTFYDTIPFDSIVYYRVKLITFFDSVIPSKWDSIRIRTEKDSLFSFSALLQSNGVAVNWSAKEVTTDNYDVVRAGLQTDFTIIHSKKPEYTSGVYSFLDELPMKDSSFYRLVMQFPNGTFRFSKTDTVYFVMDSVIDFYTQLTRDSVMISWKGVHEYNTMFYEVQRGLSHDNFSTIQKVYPELRLFDTAFYITYDTFPLPGITYYKVQQTLRGDANHYSIIDSQMIVSTGLHPLQRELDLRLTNTFTQEGMSDLTVVANSSKQLKGQFMIVDIAGRLLYSESEIIPTGTSQFVFPTAQLPSNIYFLLFRTADELVKHTFYILDDH